MRYVLTVMAPTHKRDRTPPRLRRTRIIRPVALATNALPVICRRSRRRSRDQNVRSHTFHFVTPGDTETLKIPNACNECHKDKSTEWAKEALNHGRIARPGACRDKRDKGDEFLLNSLLQCSELDHCACALPRRAACLGLSSFRWHRRRGGRLERNRDRTSAIRLPANRIAIGGGRTLRRLQLWFCRSLGNGAANRDADADYRRRSAQHRGDRRLPQICDRARRVAGETRHQCRDRVRAAVARHQCGSRRWI